MNHLEEVIGVLIPIVALMIPIVVILTRHQQRMAVILNRTDADESQIVALRQEIADLKALIHQQAITLDNIANGAPREFSRPPSAPTIADRLTNN